MANTRYVRLILAFLALLSAVCVFYLSMIPLRYQPLSWAETMAKFRDIPWLQLGIEKREDWVANGIIMIPVTFFASGAIDWGRKSRLPLMFIGPALIILVCIFAIAIEFCQIWFPPRVVSLNDLSAGVVGGICGVIAWLLVGNPIGHRIRRFVFGNPGLERISILSEAGLWTLLVYSFLPFDLILTVDELRAKFEAGRITVIPFSDVLAGTGIKQLLRLFLFCCPLVPFAIIQRLNWPTRVAVRSMLLWSCSIELAQFPIYSRNFSVTSIVISSLACVLAIAMTPLLARYLRLFEHARTWLFGACIWTATILTGFLGRFSGVARDKELILERFSSLFAVPFARAQRSTEMQAGENILLKLLIFAALAMLLAGWSDRSRKSKPFTLAIAITWIAFVALGLEIGQVFLIPLVPDITDIIIYAVGAFMGWLAFGLLVPRGDRS